MLQSWLTLRYPIQWKGGQQINLAKASGDPATMAGNRDITLSDELAKLFAGLTRGKASPLLNGATWDTQFGSGLNEA